jgi:hypothetical protein
MGWSDDAVSLSGGSADAKTRVLVLSFEFALAKLRTSDAG